MNKKYINPFSLGFNLAFSYIFEHKGCWWTITTNPHFSHNLRETYWLLKLLSYFAQNYDHFQQYISWHQNRVSWCIIWNGHSFSLRISKRPLMTCLFFIAPAYLMSDWNKVLLSKKKDFSALSKENTTYFEKCAW